MARRQKYIGVWGVVLAFSGVCGCGTLVRETGYRVDFAPAKYHVSGDGSAPTNEMSLLGGDLVVRITVEEHDLKVATAGPIIPIIPVFKSDRGLNADEMTVIVEFVSEKMADFDANGLVVSGLNGVPWSERYRQVTDQQWCDNGMSERALVMVVAPDSEAVPVEGFRVALPRVKVGSRTQDSLELSLLLDTGWRYRITF
jgi:hypothetical protein